MNTHKHKTISTELQTDVNEVIRNSVRSQIPMITSLILYSIE